jgi:hypothetical protein
MQEVVLFLLLQILEQVIAAVQVLLVRLLVVAVLLSALCVLNALPSLNLKKAVEAEVAVVIVEVGLKAAQKRVLSVLEAVLVLVRVVAEVSRLLIFQWVQVKDRLRQLLCPQNAKAENV